MIKSIKGKMVLFQGIMLVVVLGVILILFLSGAQGYYYNSKMKLMNQAFNRLHEKDLEKLKDGDSNIVNFEEQKLRFVIADENFRQIYVSANGKGKGAVIDGRSAKAKIKGGIIDKVNRFDEDEFKTINRKRSIKGRGIIKQGNHKYYVYIYEIKTTKNILFSYYAIFFSIVVLIAAAIGMIVSMIIANRISKPIKQIELNTRLAVKNGYNVKIDENQEFKELSGLAESINTMISQIRNQIEILEEEIARKEQAENIQKQFVNNVSHEMKTPLAIISTQVEMIQYLNDEEKREEYCKSIIEETENMSQMINDMISIFSVQYENENLTVKNENVSDVVRKICSEYKKLFDSNHIVLREEYDIDTYAQINGKLLKQAVSNYVSNAIKHSDEKSQVTVRVLNLNETVRIEVENMGKHIDELYKDKIWDIFYSGDVNETLNGQKGSGLGLYLVKSIAKLHNAEYGFENTDNGVIFYITLKKVQKRDEKQLN